MSSMSLVRSLEELEIKIRIDSTMLGIVPAATRVTKSLPRAPG